LHQNQLLVRAKNFDFRNENENPTMFDQAAGNFTFVPLRFVLLLGRNERRNFILPLHS
jgi:hypothetical protein